MASSDTTPPPAKVYANDGLCQVLFFQTDGLCETIYADRRDRYQDQEGIVLPGRANSNTGETRCDADELPFPE